TASAERRQHPAARGRPAGRAPERERAAHPAARTGPRHARGPPDRGPPARRALTCLSSDVSSTVKRRPRRFLVVLPGRGGLTAPGVGMRPWRQGARTQEGKGRAAERNDEEPMTRVRALCLALPETTERAGPRPAFQVRDRTFVLYMDDHHSDGRL